MVHLPPRRTPRTWLRAQITVSPRDLDGWNDLTDRMQPPVDVLHTFLGLHTEVRSEHLPELWEAFLQWVRVHGRFDEKWYQGWVARTCAPRRRPALRLLQACASHRLPSTTSGGCSPATRSPGANFPIKCRS